MSLADRLAPNPPRIFIYDIETSPHLAYTYDLFGANIRPDQIVQPSRMLCWAGKWVGSKQVEFWSEHDCDDMLQELWGAFDQADIVVGYNHRGFDNKHVMREFITAGFGPPSPWQDVDLLREVRRLFKFASNRLGYVTTALELPTKLDTNPGLWRQVLEDDPAAWRKFKAYNVADVRATEALAAILWPYMKVPHIGLFSGAVKSCPSCGGSNLTPMGKTYTKVNAYPLLLCACGAWCKVLSSGQTRPV